MKQTKQPNLDTSTRRYLQERVGGTTVGLGFGSLDQPKFAVVVRTRDK